MLENINIGKNIELYNLLKYAEEVVTEDGNKYYRFPDWFQLLPDDFAFVIIRKLPQDLSEFIVKSRLGGNNPQVKQPVL